MQVFKTFYIDEAIFSQTENKVVFQFHFDAEKPFCEEILLAENFQIRKDFDSEIVKNIIFHASIAFGISYYKLFPTERIVICSGNISQEQKDFWRNFYISGLGEFFYTHNMDFRKLAFFESSGKKVFEKKEFSLSDKVLLPIGGGKDSIVTALLLEDKKEKITPYIFGKIDTIKEDFLSVYDKKELLIRRSLDPKLFERNKHGYYNGHVPITGLISFISFLIAYLYDYKEIIFSNERSANIGSVSFYDQEINHQYSKSEDFENQISRYLKSYISGEIKYYSFLRKYYEIEIAKIFSEKGKRYFSHFSSCNKNFSLTKKAEKRWCGECPKCLFVFIVLRPFLTDTETLEIFGEDFYNKKEFENLLYETIGYTGIKPFECVGEVAEAELGVYLHYKRLGDIELPYLLKKFEEKIFMLKGKAYFEELEKKYLQHYTELFL